MSDHIRDGRTLRMLERAGHISEPVETFRPKGKSWGRGYSYVHRGWDLDSSFSHRGERYRIKYIDGCFFPFVYKITCTRSST